MKLERTTHVYIGIKKCGCVVAACCDDIKHKSDTAEFVSSLIERGLVVERVTVDSARNLLKECKCPIPDETEKKQE